MPKLPKLPQLPRLLDRKIYKTGQTRGADDDVIFQNRVGRNSTVLIPYDYWAIASVPPPGESRFENGYLGLISPQRYFNTPNIAEILAEQGLEIGQNALVYYETRVDWRNFNPDSLGWLPAVSRQPPLGGEYVARIPATTSTDEGAKINRGFTTTAKKGAGIRVYEYASAKTIEACRFQLEALFWFCRDSSQVAHEQGMSIPDITTRREFKMEVCSDNGLLDIEKLIVQRLLSKDSRTMCPLCLQEISAQGFFTRVQQADGRLVSDLTITPVNLFHIEALQIGRYGHRPYNLGWGHHHCNVVVRDAGISETLAWMEDVIDKNVEAGYLLPRAKCE